MSESPREQAERLAGPHEIGCLHDQFNGECSRLCGQSERVAAIEAALDKAKDAYKDAHTHCFIPVSDFLGVECYEDVLPALKAALAEKDAAHAGMTALQADTWKRYTFQFDRAEDAEELARRAVSDQQKLFVELRAAQSEVAACHRQLGDYVEAVSLSVDRAEATEKALEEARARVAELEAEGAAEGLIARKNGLARARAEGRREGIEAAAERRDRFDHFTVNRCAPDEDGKPPRYRLYGHYADGVQVQIQDLYLRDPLLAQARAEGIEEERRKLPVLPPKHTSACSPWCKMPHHAFSATRRLPLGEVDKSLHCCDACGLPVEALMHNVSNEENGEAIIAALHPVKQDGPDAEMLARAKSSGGIMPIVPAPHPAKQEKP